MTMLMDNRRQVPRARRCLPVHLMDADGDFTVITGRTRDIGPGGLGVSLPCPLRAAADVVVQVDLPDGGQVIANARVAECSQRSDQFDYRLIFLELADDDLAALLWVALPTGW